MTRFLSDILGFTQPNFALAIRQLEQANGNPGVDIRLSTNIQQATRDKIRELGLDPNDTTAKELYETLKQRLLDDDRRLGEYLDLKPDSLSIDILSRVVNFEAKLDLPRTCFAIKQSVMKRLLKKTPPKKAMSQIGYRSVDSMIKHEPIAQIYAAALVYESRKWQEAFLSQYSQLSASDFEIRPSYVLLPKSKRWEKIAQTFTSQYKTTNLVIKELGATVILPVSTNLPALGLTTLLILLDDLNKIRCSSSYLKLHQVSPKFGESVKQIATTEPVTPAYIAGRPLPWKFIQYYYHKLRDAYHPALFEPHVQPEDLELAEAEASLSASISSLEFWQDTSSLAYCHQGQVVSLNMLDIALSVVNSLSFEQRTAKNAKEHIWSDMISHYLYHQNQELAEQLSEATDDSVEIDQGVTI